MEEDCFNDSDDLASYYCRYRDATPESLISHRISFPPSPPPNDTRQNILCPTLSDLNLSLANPFSTESSNPVISPSVLQLRIFQLDARVALDAFCPQFQADAPAIRTTIPDAVVAPVLLNKVHQCFAVVDTGANCSVISSALAASLHLPISPAVGTIMLAGRNSVARIGTVTFSVSHGFFSTSITADVLHSQADLILGLPHLAPLGIRLVGIANKFPSVLSPSDALCASGVGISPSSPSLGGPGPAIESWHPLDSVDRSIDVSIATPEFLSTIAPHLDMNRKLLSTGYCSYPGSIVRIHTPPGVSVKRPAYPIPSAIHPIVRDQLSAWLADDVIMRLDRPSTFHVPLLAVHKRAPDRSWSKYRLCIDPRALNKLLPAHSHPMPLVSDLFRKLEGFSLATSLDLRSGFTQFRVHADDWFKLAFSFDNCHYTFKRAPFGLSFLPQHFQQQMEEMLAPVAHLVTIFVDDVVILCKPVPGESKEQEMARHAKDVSAVLEVFNRWSLRLNIDKCSWACTKLRVLGFILTSHSRSIDPEKICTLNSIPTPTSPVDVQSLLGVTGYLRDFIPRYAELARPLDLLRYAKPFKWTPEAEGAFTTLRKLVSSPPVLQTVDPTLPLIVAVDASKYGLGAMLFQEESSGKPRFISFQAKSLQDPQRNYSATKRELLGILFALEKFRYHLLGRSFELRTDHQALITWSSAPDLSDTIRNWIDVLSEYNPTMVHCPGILNVIPDALSRLYPDYLKAPPRSYQSLRKVNPDHPRVFSISVQNLMPSTTPPVLVPIAHDPSVSSEASATLSDQLPADAAIVVEDVPQHARKLLETFIHERLHKSLPSIESQRTLLADLHASGHHGSEILFRKIFDGGHYWPTLREDCLRTVARCKECIRKNVARGGFAIQRHMHATFPFDHVCVDLAQLPSTTTTGINFILILVDVATRFVILRPLMDKTALAVARAVWDICSLFGFPRRIQSDNGREFCNAVIASLESVLGIEHAYITPYNPSANGLAEVQVKLAKEALNKMAVERTDAAHEYLNGVQFALNAKVSSLTQIAPSSLMFARPLSFSTNLRHFSDAALDRVLSDQQILDRNAMMVQVLYPAVNEKVKFRLNARTSTTKKESVFEVGSYVMRIDPLRHLSHTPNWVGPFKVLAVTKARTLTLLDATGAKLVNNIPFSQAKKIADPSVFGDQDSPALVVERILDDRMSQKGRNQREYLVKWKNQPIDEASWEPVSSFNELGLLQEYNAKKASRLSPVSDVGAAVVTSPDSVSSAASVSSLLDITPSTTSVISSTPLSTSLASTCVPLLTPVTPVASADADSPDLDSVSPLPAVISGVSATDSTVDPTVPVDPIVPRSRRVGHPMSGTCFVCKATNCRVFFKQHCLVCNNCYHSLIPLNIPATRLRLKPRTQNTQIFSSI